MKIRFGNWYIMNKAEFNRRNALQIELNRRFTPEEWANIREGKVHIHRNPKRKVA